MRIREAFAATLFRSGSHNLRFRLIVQLLTTVILLAGAASSAQASCWYYWVDDPAGGKKWVGTFETEADCLHHIRAALIQNPGLKAHYIFNLCTKNLKKYNDHRFSNSNQTEQQYIKELQQAASRVKKLMTWSRENAGRLTESQFNNVNQAIEGYNSKLSQAEREFPAAFASWRRLMPISPSYMRQFDPPPNFAFDNPEVPALQLNHPDAPTPAFDHPDVRTLSLENPEVELRSVIIRNP